MTFSCKHIFKEAWQLFTKAWSQSISVILLAALILIAARWFMDIPAAMIHTNIILGIILFILCYLALVALSVVIDIGLRRFFLNLVDGKEVKVASLFSGVDSQKHFFRYLGLGLAVGAWIVLGTFFVLIPGIIIALGFMFFKYVAAENRHGFFEALRFSWQLTQGHKWRLLGLIIAMIIFNILGALALGVGLLVTLPMTHIFFAKVYRALEAEKKA